MAGIGFVLRKLTKKDDLMGVAQAYFHAAMAAAGPWILTVIAIWGVFLTSYWFDFRESAEEFRLIIIYNFSFTLVFTGPVYMVVTRYLANSIHAKEIGDIPGSLIGSLLLIFVTQIPILVLFYGFIFEFEPAVRIMAIINFLLISTVWLVAVYISSLKDYQSITFAFTVGMIVTILLMPWLESLYGTAGLLLAFSIGLLLIVFPLIALIFTQYPAHSNVFFGFWPYFARYWELAVGGFVYNAGIWVDKWIMWFAPEAYQHKSGMVNYPNYDSAMFMAYLFVLPSLALFVFSVETSFFRRYLRFYRDILNHANLRKIRENHKKVVDDIFGNTRAFVILQGSIVLLGFLMAPKIFEFFNINFLQMGMFRLGLLGTFFHVLAMFLMIVLSYFDNRKTVVLLQCLFLIFNTVLTFITMKMGFPYYGLGYFLSALLTFGFTAVAVIQHTKDLPYHAFITNNTSIVK